MTNNGPGKLITFEGVDCCGKGTQIKAVQAWLANQQQLSTIEAGSIGPSFKCFSDHEPGGTLYGEAIRGILKNPDLTLPAIFAALREHSDYEFAQQFKPEENISYRRNGRTEIFLFMASRAEFADKIKPIIDNGAIVLADRLMDSTMAYQGYGKLQGDPKILEIINILNRFALNSLWPYLTFFIDIPIDVMYERMGKQPDEKNSFFEKKYPRETFERIRQGYQRIAELEPRRVKVIDGTKIAEEVTAAIIEILESAL